MPDGWYSTANAAAAQDVIAGWALIPTVLTAPHMVHDPNNGKFRASFFMGDQTIINSIPDAVQLSSYAGIYIPGYSNYVRRIFGIASLGARIVHEWGHLMDFNPVKIGIAGVGQVGDNADLNTMWLKVNAGLPVGLYAKTNRNEWMAELFDGYVSDRKKMAACVNLRSSTGDSIWFDDPNFTAVLAMFQTYYPYAGSANFRPVYCSNDTPNSGAPLNFVGGETITLTNGLRANPAVTAYLWERLITQGGVAGSWTTLGTGATLTTTLPTGLPVGSVVTHVVSGANTFGFGKRQVVNSLTMATTLAYTAGFYQSIPLSAPKQSPLTISSYGSIFWQYRTTVQTDPNAGWVNDTASTGQTYTPSASTLSVRAAANPSVGGPQYTNICTLT